MVARVETAATSGIVTILARGDDGRVDGGVRGAMRPLRRDMIFRITSRANRVLASGVGDGATGVRRPYCPTPPGEPVPWTD
jgi:hypothetical protein